MNRDPTPKADQLRAMREAKANEQERRDRAVGIPGLKEAMAAIPARKAKKPKGRKMKRVTT